MRLPKSLNIFGRDYTIVKKSDMEDLGLLDSDTNTIYLNKNQTNEEMLHTLIHEMGHAMFRRCGFTQGIQSQMEEAIVESFSTMITEAFDLKLKKQDKKN